MKVAYHDEQAPKSLRPLVVVIVMAWVAIATGVIILSEVMK